MKKKINCTSYRFFDWAYAIVGLIVYKIDSHETEQQHIKAQLNATTYGERIKNEITNGIAITDTLKQVLISENGKISQFDTIAEKYYV